MKDNCTTKKIEIRNIRVTPKSQINIFDNFLISLFFYTKEIKICGFIYKSYMIFIDIVNYIKLINKLMYG